MKLGSTLEKKRTPLKKWINEIMIQNGYKIIELSYTFCTDHYLLQINQKYLNHNTLTDIITFDLKENESQNIIEGDIYISLERVEENANLHKTIFSTEILRVIIHGALHLCGYKDKNDEEIETMREKENSAIEKYFAMFHVK